MRYKLFIAASIVLILFGLLLRFYNLRYTTQFTWDQEDSVAYPARSIVVDHDLKLVGAKTGVGDLRIGPLYSYLASIFFAVFNNDPVAGAYLAATIAVVTVAVGFFLISRVFNRRVAFFFALMWSTSAFVVQFDRIPWNVNLLPLAAILTICGLFMCLKNEKRVGWVSIGIGFFLGVNSHASVVLLLIGVVGVVLLNRKILHPFAGFAFLFLIIGLLPLVLFDFRHEFMLSRNLYTFVSGSKTPLFLLLSRFNTVLKILFETIGRIVVFDGPSFLQQFVGLIIVMGFFVFRKLSTFRNYLMVFVVFSVSFLLGFSLYKGSISDYYFLGLLPLAVIGMAVIMDQLIKYRQTSSIFIIALSVFMVLTATTHATVPSGDSLGAKQDIVEAIKQHAENQKISINYDMEFGKQFGYEYLLDYYNVNRGTGENLPVYWISFPDSRFPGNADYTSHAISLGFPETAMHIYETKELLLYGRILLRIPNKWSVLQCPKDTHDTYVLTPDSFTSCASFGDAPDTIEIFFNTTCDRETVEIEEYKSMIDGNEFNTVPSDTDKEIIFSKEVGESQCIVFHQSLDSDSLTTDSILYDIDILSVFRD